MHLTGLENVLGFRIQLIHSGATLLDRNVIADYNLR